MSVSGAAEHGAGRGEEERLAVAEISGADSLAAVLRYARMHPEVQTVVPTYARTGTEYGDFDVIRRNVTFLSGRLADMGVGFEPLVELGDPKLWAALNGRWGSTLAERFPGWTPCTGCHLYLHLVRAPLARESGGVAVISGERERHGARVKPNQTPTALDAYARVLAGVGVRLEFPLRHVVEGAAIDAILGDGWPGGSPQLGCVLSGNYLDLDGEWPSGEDTREFLDWFLVPAGERLARAVVAGEDSYVPIVRSVLAEALA